MAVQTPNTCHSKVPEPLHTANLLGIFSINKHFKWCEFPVNLPKLQFDKVVIKCK